MTSSKSSPPSPPHAASLDNSIGWVSLSEINNVWVEFMRQLDRDICPAGGRSPSRHELLTFVETLKFRLMSKAEDNYKRFLKSYPNAAKPAGPVEPGKDSREDFQKWKQGVTR